MSAISKFILCIALLMCTTLANSADSSYTSNIVTSTWNNGYSVPELTCWGDARGSTNCSPGGIPYVRPDGSINFSYSFTELYQAKAMADVLPYSGSGLMVTGFQFNWMSKNGNYWDDARQDQLSAYVQMYSKTGKWIESQSYNLNYIHEWTNFSWTGTFSKERRGSDLGTILYGFAGKDNNYWLGPYGPEIINVSFQLRYQPDPCVVNPLHSTECLGFMRAITISATTSTEALANSTSVNSSSSDIATNVRSAIGVIKLNVQKEQDIINSIADVSIGTSKNETSQTASTILTGIVQDKSRQRLSQTTDVGLNSQEQDLSTLNSANTSSTLSWQSQINLPQKSSSKLAESLQSILEQDMPVLNPQNSSNISLGQHQAIQKFNNRSRDVGQNIQDQDSSGSTTIYSNPITLSLASPTTAQKVQNTAQSYTQASQELESVQTSSISSSLTINLNQSSQNQRTNQKAADNLQQTEQEQLVGLSNQVTSAFTIPAAPTLTIKSTTRNQDMQTSSHEQEQSQVALVIPSTILSLFQLPVVQKLNQKIESQNKSETPIDNGINIEQLITQNTANNQTSIIPVQNLQSNQNQTVNTNNQEIVLTTQTHVLMPKTGEISQITASEQVNTDTLEKPIVETQILPANASISIVPLTVVDQSPVLESIRPQQIETASTDTSANNIANALIDRTSPLNSVLQTPQITQTNSTFTGPVVKSNTADNELATNGINITQIARIPAGFDAYTTMSLQQIAFYQPKEIYKGQRTVDNARALRSLSQDTKHQEMVNQQYGGGRE
jgi:hypothetical protein